MKHQGKKYDVDLDPTTNGEVLKFQLFSLTGVEPERQSVLIRGGKLKDDTDLSKMSAKPGQVFIMMGTPSNAANVVVAPMEKTKFAEDMTEAEAARQEGATPAGLQNLGNTCYLNSSLQVLKSMPEMQTELASYHPSDFGAGPSSIQSLSQFGLGGLGSSSDLVASLRDLYKQMSETQEGFPPLVFLNALRTAYPQFAQKAKSGNGYAQQDAEEVWSNIVQQLRTKLKISNGSNLGSAPAFVDRYMAGKFESTLTPPEEVGDSEQPVQSSDVFLKLDCHIDVTINHLRDGLSAGLTTEIEKRSPTLERNAIYKETSRIARLPKYLTVHMIRFFWRKDTSKKAKILRKVSFPPELDMVEYCSDSLKKKLIPVRDKIRDIRKDEQDIERARKRQKLAHKQEEDRKADAANNVEAAPIAKAREAKEKKEGGSKDEKAGKSSKENEAADSIELYKTDAEYEAERAESIRKAKQELFAAIDPDLLADDGANKSGIYELRAVVAHQGSSADSGHYTSFVKKAERIVDDPKAVGGKRKEEDGKWWWFNDDKVSEVEYDRIETLGGGGESASALILLYRAIDLPTKDEAEI